MKITKKHKKLSSAVIHEFYNFHDLRHITSYIQEKYDPIEYNCYDICKDLCEEYANLKPMIAPILIHNGKMEVESHCVLACYDDNENIQWIVDPTCDQFDADDIDLLKSQMSPWIYNEIDCGIFCSVNHMPAGQKPFIKSDQDALICSSGEGFGLYRFIIL